MNGLSGRTEAEYGKLYEQPGFELTRVVATHHLTKLLKMCDASQRHVMSNG
jgi:hypothetical protein